MEQVVVEVTDEANQKYTRVVIAKYEGDDCSDVQDRAIKFVQKFPDRLSWISYRGDNDTPEYTAEILNIGIDRIGVFEHLNQGETYIVPDSSTKPKQWNDAFLRFFVGLVSNPNIKHDLMLGQTASNLADIYMNSLKV